MAQTSKAKQFIKPNKSLSFVKSMRNTGLGYASGNQTKKGSNDIDTSGAFFPRAGAPKPKSVGARSGKRAIPVTGGSRGSYAKTKPVKRLTQQQRTR